MRCQALIIALVAAGAAGCRREPHDAVRRSESLSAPAGVAVSEDSSEALLRADSLDALDPVAEAEKAIEHHDLRFLAVCGYACVPPGIDWRQDGLTAADLYNIPGTSDYIRSRGIARLNESASRYAIRYNQVILRHRAH